MKFVSLKQYVKYAAPIVSVAVLMVGMTSGLFVNQPKASAAALKTVADCRNQFKPAKPSNPKYVNCVNNDTYEAMIFRAYRGVLGRHPEPNPWLVYDYWLPIAKKSSNPTEAVVSTMMKTKEYQQSTFGKTANHTNWTKTLYTRTLDRPASASEASYWTSQLTSGKTRVQVAATVVQSPEAKKAPGSVINAPCYIAADACAD